MHPPFFLVVDGKDRHFFGWASSIKTKKEFTKNNCFALHSKIPDRAFAIFPDLAMFLVLSRSGAHTQNWLVLRLSASGSLSKTDLDVLPMY